jgi:hypothetical protein
LPPLDELQPNRLELADLEWVRNDFILNEITRLEQEILPVRCSDRLVHGLLRVFLSLHFLFRPTAQ